MSKLSVRSALLAAVSLAAVHSTAQAQLTTDGASEFSFSTMVAEDAPYIVSNNNINPNTAAPGGALDAGVTGVGQMIVFA